MRHRLHNRLGQLLPHQPVQPVIVVARQIVRQPLPARRRECHLTSPGLSPVVMLHLAQGRPKQPRPEAIRMLHLFDTLDHFQEGLLEQILGQIVVQRQAIDVAREPPPRLLGQAVHAPLVPELGLLDQLDNIVTFTHRFHPL